MQDLVKRFVAGWLQGDRKAQRRALVAREKAVKASIKHAMQNVDTLVADLQRNAGRTTMEDEREVTVGLLRSLAENYKKGQLSDPQRGKILKKVVALESKDELCHEILHDILPVDFVISCCPQARELETVAAAMRRHNIEPEPLLPTQQQ
eukprot:jgi/Astpho2/7349/Aster-01944